MRQRLRLADGQPPWAQWVLDSEVRGGANIHLGENPSGSIVGGYIHDARSKWRGDGWPTELPDGFIAVWWGRDGLAHVSADVSRWRVRVRSTHPSRPIQDETDKLMEAGVIVLGHLSESMELDVQVPNSDALDRLFDTWLPFTVDPRGP